MNLRASRFMDVISNSKNEVIFLCMIDYQLFIEKSESIYQDIIKLDTNTNIKCKYKVLVYLNNDNTDYDFIIPIKMKHLEHIVFDKYIRNKCVCPVYGDYKDFHNLLMNNNLL